jgi:hypothetical protein
VADINPEHLLDQVVIDTFPRIDTHGCQVDVLGAALDPQTLVPRDLRELSQQQFIALRFVSAVSEFRFCFSQS